MERADSLERELSVKVIDFMNCYKQLIKHEKYSSGIFVEWESWKS